MKNCFYLFFVALCAGMLFVSCKDDSDPVGPEDITVPLAKTSYAHTEETTYQDEVMTLVITQTITLSFIDDTNVVLRYVTETMDRDTGEKYSSSIMDQMGSYTVIANIVQVHITKAKVTADGKVEEIDTNIFYDFSYNPNQKTLTNKDNVVFEKK